MSAAQQHLCAALCLLCIFALPVLSQPGYNPYPDYSCPAGYLPIARFSLPQNGDPPTICDEDKCYNEAVGCGPGNVCTQSPVGSVGGYFYQHDCLCNAPYIKGTVVGYKGLGYHNTCYVPDQDPCASNPCQNGGTCQQIRTTLNDPSSFPGLTPDPNGPIIDFSCQCPVGFLGKTCLLAAVGGTFPIPVPKNAPPSGPPSTPPSGSQGVCGSGAASPFPTRCWFNNDPQGRYVCCDGQGCDGFNGDNLTPHCKNNGYVPPNFGAGGSTTPPATPPSGPLSGSQGVCGSGAATDFPTRCWFNNDPQGRYVCCDGQGCDGFNADNLTPHCKNNGYVPPGFGAGGSSTPPSGPPASGSQGVCGAGGAANYPIRCYYNNDPQGRYVCCDAAGCDGFNPPDNLFPHCKNNGYVPPNF